MIVETQELDTALARLDRLTNWEAAPRVTMRQDLRASRSLLKLCGDPHYKMRFVHVTGTKGKGSVCSLLERALLAAGVTVGRYSSPHLTSVTERFSICGSPIHEEVLAPLIHFVVDRIESARANFEAAADATWFDAMTAVAFLAFEATGCEWVVLEVGLGGRFDSTNVAMAEIAVITNVELEHTEVLGQSRCEIAYQKVGIVKSGAVLVTPLGDEDEVGRLVHAEAAAAGARVHVVAKCEATITETNVAIAGAVLDEIGQAGSNASDGLGREIGRRLLTSKLVREAALPGRMEHMICQVQTDGVFCRVLVVLDGAHVPFNIEAVLRDLAGHAETASPCVSLFAAADDKDAAGLLATLRSRTQLLLLTTLPSSVRMTHPARLAFTAQQQGFDGHVELSPERALHQALLEGARLNTWVFITGSLHLVGFVRPLLFHRYVEQAADLQSTQIEPSNAVANS